VIKPFRDIAVVHTHCQFNSYKKTGCSNNYGAPCFYMILKYDIFAVGTGKIITLSVIQ